MFQVYTDNVVFEDGTANIVCNLVHQYLIEKLDAGTIAANFALTGMTARIIQGDPAEPITVISFATTQDDIFSYCIDGLKKFLNASGAVLFDDQVQLVYNDSIFLEFWHLDSLGTLITENDIVMQDKANIPAYII